MECDKYNVKYNIKEENKKVIVKNIKDFNPVHVFECGQCFRWVTDNGRDYTGVVGNKVINVELEGDSLVINNSTVNEFVSLWYHYFDLGRDYSKIKEILAGKDQIMKEAIEFGYGIRLLQQDPWETLISFIISANNRIPMIKKTISSLSACFGKQILLEEKSYHTFPQIDDLANTDIENIRMCGGGFRCKYIKKTSEMIKQNLVDLRNIYNLDTEGAREILQKLPGVGPKVADCILLYSGKKYDVFPTDVWVKRIMEELYFNRTVSFKEIQNFARDYFGYLAGFAQQYLFYYARENKIGVK